MEKKSRLKSISLNEQTVEWTFHRASIHMLSVLRFQPNVQSIKFKCQSVTAG